MKASYHTIIQETMFGLSRPCEARRWKKSQTWFFLLFEQINKEHLTGIQPENVMEFGSSQVIKESVEAGLGLAFLSETVIRKELALGTLLAIRIQAVPIYRNFSYVIHDSQFQTKACELFLNYLKSIYSK